MRVLKRFSLPELMCAARAGESSARGYLNALEHADMVRQVGRPGYSPGDPQEFRLIRDTGRLAPKLSYDASQSYGAYRRVLYDRNTGETHDISRDAVKAKRAREVNYVR